jgi:2-C-methyl-D-erythritol 4-phosphate cytidylyltransferase / 2-C-methyl-D-erythritol 2,4-cyclodiphosphate synthase
VSGPERGAATAPAETAAEVMPSTEAVVVAAGSSRRMGGPDKLDMVLAGKTVLRRSLEALVDAGVTRIVLVTSSARVAELAAAEWMPEAVVSVVAGGERRQESVAAGIAALAELPPAAEAGSGQKGGAGRTFDPIVLVHDAARPLATPALIRAVALAVAEHGAAIPVLPVAETLKRLEGDGVGSTIDRTNVVTAQTPQGARRSLFARAYETYSPFGPEIWTDEAALLEACRIPVHAVSGEATNLKVTVPADILRASAILEDRSATDEGPAAYPSAQTAAVPTWSGAGRIGLGTDSHPFGPGEPLVLGGVTIAGAPRLAGHSDGDVVLHAVADALLGAAGLGDLGRLFPADSRTPKGVDSRVLLGAVAAKLRGAGWRPANVDLTVVGARPRLAGLLPAMEEQIAAAVGMDRGAVNVKASTGNLSGPEGAGRSISASAIVWIVPTDRRDA